MSVSLKEAFLLLDGVTLGAKRIIMINIEVLEKAAKLSSLVLTEEEKQKTIKEMSKILEHFTELQKVDTKGVEPTYTAVEMVNVWRGDKISCDETTEELLEVLLETQEGQLKVPQVV